MTETILKKEFGALRAADDASKLVLDAIPSGVSVSANIRDTRKRSGRQHRLFFAMLNKVWENQEHYKTVDELRFALMIRLGRTDAIVMRGGEVHYKPQSIAFGKMSQEEFNRLMNDAVKFFTEEVIPGMNRADLEAEFMEMVA